MSYIEIKNLTKSYGDNVVLKDLSLTMEKGTLNTLLGASGSGKSTLLRSIAGLEEIDSGEIYIDGRDVTNVTPKERNIGMVFQHYALFPNMTVEANVAFGLDMQNVEESEKNRRVSEMIERVGLKGKEKELPRNLSGGQQQRVALARSLVTEPAVLLLDEPLSALDAKIRVELRRLIKDIQGDLGITIILVTHDQEEAMTMSERIFVMEAGLIEQVGSPSEIYRSPRTEFVAEFIGNHNLYTIEEFKELSGDSSVKGKLIAIRPETLTTVKPAEEHYKFEVKLVRSSMMGSLLRYWLEVDGNHQLIMDNLNRSVNFKDNGTEFTVYLPKSDLIYID